MFDKFTKVKIDERSWRFYVGLAELDFKELFILTDSNTFFVNNINENKISRILSKEWYGSANEKNYRMYQLKRKNSVK